MIDFFQDAEHCHRVYMGLEGLYKLKDDWNRLYQQLERPAYYQDWRWMHALVKWLIAGPVFFVTVRKSDRTVLILPLQAGKVVKGGVRHSFLGFLDHTHIVLSDLICDRSQVSSFELESLVGFLSKQKLVDWSVLFLNGYTEDSQLFGLLGEADEVQREKSRNAYFRLRNGDFEEGLSKKFIKNIKRLEKKAVKEIGKVSASFDRNSQNSSTRFDMFMDLEASGWKGEKGTSTAIKHDPALVSFYREIVQSFSENNACSINLLDIEGTPVAGQLSIRCGSVWYILKVAYEESMKLYGVGNLLMLKLLEFASSDESVDEINLVTAPEWSRRWHLQTRPVFGYQHFNSNFKGRVSRVIADARSKVKSLSK
jgi:hypothetical protein